MERMYIFFVVLLSMSLVESSLNLHVRPAVRTLDTQGYQLTNNANVGSWLLRIMRGKRFACGAAYYSPNYVLTSASCMHQYKNSLDYLSVEFMSGEDFALIDQIFVPKEYEYPHSNMDIAVVKLINPIPGTKEGDFVKLCSQSPHDFDKLTVVACSSSHRNINTQQVHIMKRWECEEQYPHVYLAETVICTHGFDLTKNCMYDYGCPVTAGDELCGIVPNGPECNNPQLPGLFTDIYQVKEFIIKAMNTNKNIARTHAKVRQTWFDK